MDKAKRIEEILELLQAYPDGVSGEFISRQIGVSSRTIRTDIKILQKMISGSSVQVKSAPRKGYVLSGDKKEMLDSTLRQNMTVKRTENPVSYIICRLLEKDIADETITQMELADELYVSLSTLKTYFAKCKKNLNKYNIQIISYKKNGLKIEGTEVQIRNCVFDYMNLSKKFHQKIIADIDIISIDEIISKVLREGQLEIPDTDKNILCLHMAIALVRDKNGHNISYPISTVKKIDKTVEYEIAKNLLEYMYAVLKIDVDYNEIYYITQCLLVSKKFFNAATNRENLEVKKIVVSILKKIKDEFLIDFTDDRYLADGLSLHLTIAINRIQFQMNIRNELLETIKNDYPLAFQMGVVASKVVEKSGNININENEIGYIALHFGAALSRKGINEEKTAAKKIVIACAAGLGIAVLLKAKLTEYFKNKLDVIKIIPAYNVDDDLLQKVDYIFTTVPITNIKSDKIIKINNILKEDDIEKIQRQVFGSTTITKGYLENFLPKANFFTAKNFISKEE
ncbi:BglG family transcription antiterminator [Pectinatus brassicae]|uniref:Lichenan operon transcriptional antiterminator n=1 Tax=Pectinatus brassicae TaxID=862415 RepID=A0A840UKD4_9FIRM|nr:transcription antiterminator [Pectinatus brassicae]MBB5335168.1 lichenan operon transcriptional antiterminator [Pectinatus brassicae]